MLVAVHWNKNKKLWAVRDRGAKTLRYVSELTLQDVSFTVRPGGHRDALRTGHRNVHAFVRGLEIPSPPVKATDKSFRARYDPFIAPYFRDDLGHPLWGPFKFATLSPLGVVTIYD